MQFNAIRERAITLFHSSRLQGLVWICGGCLWLMALADLGQPSIKTPSLSPFRLQGTMIDSGRCLAVINGRAVAAGEPIATDAGVFRVRSVEPRRAVLERGRQTIELSLSPGGNSP